MGGMIITRHQSHHRESRSKPMHDLLKDKHGHPTRSVHGMLDWPLNITTALQFGTQSRQVRIINQLMWFPTQPFPKLDNLDLIQAAIKDAIAILQSPPTETFVSTLESNHRSQLIHFFDTLQQQHPPPHKTSNAPTTAEANAPSIGVSTVAPRHIQCNQARASAAVNPDTGTIAECWELQKSAAGERWELAMNKELG